MQQKVKHALLGALALLSFTWGASSWASASTAIIEPAATVGKGKPERALPKLHYLDVMDVKAGEMAASKACNEQVELYADQLAIDHFTHRIHVLRHARHYEVKVNPAIFTHAEYNKVVELEQDLKRVKAISTCSFDKEFLEAMIETHAFAIEVVRASMTSDNDATLRAFLESTLTSLQAHYQRAQDLLSGLD